MGRDRFAHLRGALHNPVTDRALDEHDVLRIFCAESDRPLALVTRTAGGERRTFMRYSSRTRQTGTRATHALFIETASAPCEASCGSHLHTLDPRQVLGWADAGESRRAV